MFVQGRRREGAPPPNGGHPSSGAPGHRGVTRRCFRYQLSSAEATTLCHSQAPAAKWIFFFLFLFHCLPTTLFAPVDTLVESSVIGCFSADVKLADCNCISHQGHCDSLGSLVVTDEGADELVKHSEKEQTTSSADQNGDPGDCSLQSLFCLGNFSISPSQSFMEKLLRRTITWYPHRKLPCCQ